LAGRLAIAHDFVQRFDYALPFVIDGMDNVALRAYAAWPERLYAIGADGRVAYKGGIGPFKFDPDELADWLSSLESAS
jgi:iodothyronine deiodinase-like protein